jgi:hypothetical protein
MGGLRWPRLHRCYTLCGSLYFFDVTEARYYWKGCPHHWRWQGHRFTHGKKIGFGARLQGDFRLESTLSLNRHREPVLQVVLWDLNQVDLNSAQVRAEHY